MRVSLVEMTLAGVVEAQTHGEPPAWLMLPKMQTNVLMSLSLARDEQTEMKSKST